ncbi:hypothetical protein DPMN_075313 [Dreissena polymorpha]|uniref:Uncharacterized protein n=1 Tax=Dreissena polymorpha TaxID=45954 RepID=A0A9D4BPA4_DREPO|nr:hypothetical protein DPMN_075313 [Dreissena polymorpha]
MAVGLRILIGILGGDVNVRTITVSADGMVMTVKSQGDQVHANRLEEDPGRVLGESEQDDPTRLCPIVWDNGGLMRKALPKIR